MKTAIVYASVHHKNTEKVVKAIAEKHPEIELIDATKTILKDLASYDLIGFASGIFYGKFHKSLLSFITENLPLRKKVFVMYTCGSDRAEAYLKDIKDLIKSKECTLTAAYSCLAYDTFGPFKLLGGINKGHPNEADLQKAVDFYEGLCK
ncbi:Flavodoxin [Treponema bryantii]|uniref:Flavodoxin n=1 Tax=Treponema bryantii TaxID=163 RepID=A0A1I3LQP9_9SPIR|nr:flavodoxin family protein [Treponema bryantii]SFI87089.1 Flavodoxin [Treponema bryantii]